MNLIKLVFRILVKQRQMLIISVISLSVCMSLLILTSGYLASELSCDKYQSNYNSTFRLVNKTFNEVGLEDKFYNNLTTSFPAIDKVCRLYKNRCMLSIDEKVINIDNLVIVDSTFFDIFDYHILIGNKKHLLNAPDKIVISLGLANKLFGDNNPIGKQIKINMMATATVTGVFADNNNKSHFDSDALVSLSTKDLPYTGGSYWNNDGKWEIKKFSFYLTVKEHSDTSAIRKLIKAQYVTPWESEKPNIVLQPLGDIYWNPEIKDYSTHANLQLIFLLITISILVLIIAGINYTNLSLSNLQKESKIVGVLKVHGAKQGNMLKYYALSGISVLGLSFFIAVLASIALLPELNQLLTSNFSLNVLLKTVYLLPFTGLLLLISGLIGIYPALVFSAIKPLNLFRGKITDKVRLSSISKLLLVFQFVAIIVLISGVFFIMKQISFMKNTNPGFETSYLINQDLHYSIKDNQINTYCQELQKCPDILKLSLSEGIPLEVHMYSGQQVNGKDISFLNIKCDTGFINILELKLLEGRNLLPSDENNCIITKKLAADCGFKNPLNEKISNQQIIGIVDDIHGQSMHHKIQGIMFGLITEKPSDLTIKINSTNIPGTILFLKNTWTRLFPDYPFNYDDIIAQQYEKEQRLVKSIAIAAILATILCCLGLLGLVLHLVESKLKEIGIRKVNGARTSEVMAMLNRDFVKWVVIAFLIACPIAWYAMYKWLENFAYKTDLSWWVFAAAGVIATLIALLTVSFQSWRAATRNPVESLRYE